VTPQRRQLAVLVAVLVAAVIVVALVLVLPGDGDSSPKASPTTTSATSAQPTPTPTPSPTVKAELVSSMDVKVSGDFGKKPKLTVPDDDPSKKLLLQIVSEGDGPAVVAGQTTVLDYLGQTWKPKKGKANVFDNSFDRKTPSVFVAGSPDLIAGWNAAVVGLKVGSRALVSIPPKFGYGAKKEEGKELSGETLLFVIDIHAAYAPDATADGAEVAPTVEGLPEVESKSGQKPKITSIEGASADGDKPRSGLLIEGTGEKIDPARKLVFQVVETKPGSTEISGDTWTQGGPQVVDASQILQMAKALIGQRVGSRAVVVVMPPSQEATGTTPTSPSGPVSLVVDIIGQV